MCLKLQTMCDIILMWEQVPLLGKEVLPMGYVTHDELIQIGIFLVALIGLVIKIYSENKK